MNTTCTAASKTAVDVPAVALSTVCTTATVRAPGVRISASVVALRVSLMLDSLTTALVSSKKAHAREVNPVGTSAKRCPVTT